MVHKYVKLLEGMDTLRENMEEELLVLETEIHADYSEPYIKYD